MFPRIASQSYGKTNGWQSVGFLKKRATGGAALPPVDCLLVAFLVRRRVVASAGKRIISVVLSEGANAMSDVAVADALAGRSRLGNPSPSRAGFAPAAIQKAGSRSSPSTTGRASIRSKWSRRRRCRITQARCCTSRPAVPSSRPGSLSARRGRGRLYEIQATELKVVGLGGRPGHVSDLAEAPHV